MTSLRFFAGLSRTKTTVPPPVARLTGEIGRLETSMGADISLIGKDGLPVVFHADDAPAFLVYIFHQ
jgi:hypothetical protein